jgi:hypothetical protein
MTQKMKKIGMKLLFLLLVVVSGLAFGRSVSSQEPEPWQKDWRKFGEIIAPYAREGVVERRGNVMEFNRNFSREVEWFGTLRRFYSNGVAKFLRLEMEPIKIPLRDGSVVEVSELSIACAVKENGCEGWSAELVGREVTFRTKLINRTRGILPVVRVEDFDRKNRRIEIETDGAELVGVIPK